MNLPLPEGLRAADLNPPGRGRVLVAFSGGPDSTALAALLKERRPQCLVGLASVRHGFGTPDQESAEVEVLRATATALELPLLLLPVQPPKRWRRGMPIPEAAARSARYAALDEQARAFDADVIALAHHAGDLLESQLLHLSRGCGLRGVRGMRRERAYGSVRVWRPLLGVSREALDGWLSERELPYVADPTNLDLRMRRNFLRHAIVPALAARGDPWPLRHRRLSALASSALRRIDDVLDGFLDARSLPAARTGLFLLPHHALARLSPSLLHHLVERVAARCGIPARFASRDHSSIVGEWLHAVSSQGQQRVGSLRIERSGDLVSFQREDATAAPGDWVREVGPEAMAPPGASWSIRRVLPEVRGVLRARTRRPGDRVRIPGRGSRRLKDVYQEHPVARAERDWWPVLEDDRGIAWVPGCTRAESWGDGSMPSIQRIVEVTGLPDLDARRASFGARAR